MAVSPAPRLTRGVHLGYALGVAAGVGGGKLPERMAPVHALVSALPRPVAERLLAGVLGQVYRPVTQP